MRWVPQFWQFWQSDLQGQSPIARLRQAAPSEHDAVQTTTMRKERALHDSWANA
jgi:hypothetical protein